MAGGLLVDAGRRKLTVVVLGYDQQRALHQAPTRAALAIAAALDSSSGN